jgi:hypothetical protein
VVVPFVELIALEVGVYGVTRERRGQIVGDAAVGGDLAQIRGVKGRVSIRRRTPSGVQAGLSARIADRPLPGDAQLMTGSPVAGDLNQIDDVDGDVELE